LESVGAAVVLDVREDGLDHHLALLVERVADLAFKDASHERVETFVASGPGCLALERLGADERLDAVAHELLDVSAVPVAGVGDDDLGWPDPALIPDDEEDQAS
jgi:hypothetical protein